MELRLKWLAAIVLSLICHFAGAAEAKIVFPKKSIVLNNKKLVVEVATTDAEHEQGLMFRKRLANSEGMIFIFKDEQVRLFWMKNTLINLSIGYFNKDKKLIDIQEMKAVISIMQQDLPTYPSSAPAMYALEMPEGWFKKNKVPLGSLFRFL